MKTLREISVIFTCFLSAIVYACGLIISFNCWQQQQQQQQQHQCNSIDEGLTGFYYAMVVVTLTVSLIKPVYGFFEFRPFVVEFPVQVANVTQASAMIDVGMYFISTTMLFLAVCLTLSLCKPGVYMFALTANAFVVACIGAPVLLLTLIACFSVDS